ncbi:MAG: beta-ketoacyl-ACP synthase II [Deltaproteobacteria bacterium]|nr:beta-ketoacyl-ACP synthase II [Deltaproteobacteria bacterium]
MPRRVAVTGVGLVTPVGVGTEETWRALLRGDCGIGPITRFDAASFSTRFAGEVKGFDPTRWISAREAKAAMADSFVQYAMAAGAMAMEDAGLVLEGALAERAGCFVGSGMGGVSTIEATCQALHAKGPRHGISPFFVTQIAISLAAGQLSIRHNARGPCYSQVSACSSGAHAIGDGLRVIQRGDADVMLCGGTEAVVTPLGVGGFAAMHALSTRNDAPALASRPFDLERDGFVLAEGAGILVLEELERARRRGARIYAECKGYAANADAHHITAPAVAGEGAQRCMRAALADAQLDGSEIDYVNAHGTSTKMNDAVETFAIKQVFGAHARRLMVSSTKSMTGHLIGAAGSVEGALCVLAVARGQVPPTINYTTPDPDCDLDYVPNIARDAKLRNALSNSFGFGGTNACLIFGRHEG